MAGLRRLSAGHWLLAIVAFGAIVRFAGIGSQDYWFDELMTTEIVKLHFGEILPRVALADANPPLFYLLDAGWERIFGGDPAALRSLSAIFGVATIPVLYAAGRELASSAAGLVAAALTAFSPLMIWYSQEARPYALLVLLAAVSFLCFVHVLHGDDRRWLWGWAIASGLALCTHYLAALLVVFEAGWMLWRRREARAEVVLASAAVSVPGVFLVPLVAAQQAHGGWITFLDLPERVLVLPEHLVIGLVAPSPVIAPLALGVVVAAAVVGYARSDPGTRRAAGLAAAAVAFGFAVTLLAAFADRDYLITRNLLALWVPLVIGLGVLLGSPGAGWVGPAAVAFTCALGVGLAAWTSVTPEASRADWDPVLAELGPAHEQRVIVTQPLAAAIATKLPGSRVVGQGESVTTREVDVVDLREVDDFSIGPCWWAGFCGGRQVLDDNHLPIEVPPQFELVDQGTSGQFVYRRYRAPEPVALPGPDRLDGVVEQVP
jgi:4-amino-4-deoxy-L-arabinose transferase-like glycosyltransferase